MITLTITELTRSPSKLRAALKSGDVRIVWKDQKPGGRVIESAIVKRESGVDEFNKAAKTFDDLND